MGIKCCFSFLAFIEEDIKRQAVICGYYVSQMFCINSYPNLPTCFNFGVISPLCHLLLTDEVINNSHSDWWLCMIPFYDDQ